MSSRAHYVYGIYLDALYNAHIIFLKGMITLIESFANFLARGLDPFLDYIIENFEFLGPVQDSERPALALMLFGLAVACIAAIMAFTSVSTLAVAIVFAVGRGLFLSGAFTVALPVSFDSASLYGLIGAILIFFFGLWAGSKLRR